jgi:RND family efflux transporter MFP subunit
VTAESRIPDRTERSTRQPVPRIEHDDDGIVLPPPASLSPTRAIAIGLGVLVVLGGAFAVTYIPMRHSRQTLEASTRRASTSVVRVEVVIPTVAASTRALSLPGSVHPLEETVIFPRANGYLRRWLVDIGDHVQEGQLLAEIDTPEIDQDLAQARAQLAQAQASLAQSEANRDFAQTDLERYRQLAPAGLASRQEFDQRQANERVSVANVSVARATVAAQRAAVDRLLQLKSFARVVAPFSGTIASRSVDRGALLTAGNSTPLFRIVAMDPARVFVQLPQDVAPSVRPGLAARVTVREYAGRNFDGQVARAAGALDPASRTMNTEVRIPNTDGALISGMYADVAITLPVPHRVLELPATAVMSDSRGVRVQVVGPEGRMHFNPIVIERDTGATVQVATGLSGDERVIRVAVPSLTDGSSVDVVPPSAHDSLR